MRRTLLTVLLIVSHLTSCSSIATALPTSPKSPTESKIISTRVIAASPQASESGFTPTVGGNTPPTPEATQEMTHHSCPDPWFQVPQPFSPPIFLLIFSGIYAAYRYDQPASSDLFELPKDPAKSFAAAFSQEQQMIAYYLPMGKSGADEVWISDVQLCKPILIYTDQDGRISESFSYSYFQWGPGDKTVIFRNREAEFPMLIYQLDDQKLDSWQGACEDVLYLEETNEVVVGCSHDGIYSYLHTDGRITTAASIPNYTDTPVVDWSFSIEGDAAYITEAHDVYLLRRDGERIKLPFDGYTRTDLWDPYPLQWAVDKDRLLILAYDPENKRCPSDRACWFVIEGDSGEVTWWLKPEIIEKGAQFNWNEIDTVHPAAIFSDGELLALQYFRLSLKNLLIVRLSTNEVLTEANIFSDRMAWPK